MAIVLTESHLDKIVFKILNKEDKKKRKLTFTEKFENLIEFHVKYHKGLYNLYGNYSELDKNKGNYLDNLFPGNHKVIKECRLRFPNNIINESRRENYIDDFFNFIKENYLKQLQKSIISEQQKPAQPQQQKQLTPQQTQAAKAKIVAQAKQQAEVIYKELMKSLDMDGDKDFKDYDGTDEGGALTAIKKIKNRETLDALNKRIALTKQYPNLKSWLNAEMSDFDNEYGAIWAKLEKMGYAGANRNVLLKFAGQTGVGQLIKAGDKGIDWLRKNGIGGLMEKLRSALNSGVGQAVQLFLDSFGIGAIANAAIWGVLVVWDLINVDVGGWGIFLLSALSLLTVGAMAPILAPLARLIKPLKGGLSTIISKIMSSKAGQALAKWIPKIMEGATKVAGWIGSGVKWLVDKFSFILPAKWVTAIQGAVNKAVGWVKSITDNLVQYSTHEASDVALTSAAGTLGNKFPGVTKLLENPKWAKTLSKLDKPTAKVLDTYIHDNVRKYGWEATEKGICSYMGEVACYAAKKIGVSFKFRKFFKKSTSKTSSALSADIGTKTKEELASMTPQERAEYAKMLGKQTQKVVSDTQKAVKSGTKAADLVTQTGVADLVTNVAQSVTPENLPNVTTGIPIAGNDNQIPKQKQSLPRA